MTPAVAARAESRSASAAGDASEPINTGVARGGLIAAETQVAWLDRIGACNGLRIPAFVYGAPLGLRRGEESATNREAPRRD